MDYEKLATNQTVPENVQSKEIRDVRGSMRGGLTRVDSSSPSNAERSYRRPHRKESLVINLVGAEEVYAALVHACHSGLAPNRFVTINWAEAGVDDSIAATGKFLKLMRDCFSRRGNRSSIAYIWIREDGAKHGEHVHILLYLPEDMIQIFARRKAGWLKRCGASRGKGISNTGIIRGAAKRGKQSVANPDLYDVNLSHVRDYILKHCSREVQNRFGIRCHGPVKLKGKRVSISQNIHRKARSRCKICNLAAVDCLDT